MKTPEPPVSPVYGRALEQQLRSAADVRRLHPFARVTEYVSVQEGRGGGPPKEIGLSHHMDGVIAQALDHATPHFWADRMVDLLEASYPNLPDWTMRATDIATPSGYIWFERPVQMVEGDPERLQALLWTPVERGGMAMYLIVPFTVYDREALRRSGMVLVNEPPFGGLPRRPFTWTPGLSLSGWLREIETLYSDGEFARRVSTATGLDPVLDLQQSRTWGRIFATAVALMGQTLVKVAPHRLDRASRRRLPQPLQQEAPLVRAVLLRRTEYIPGPGAGAGAGAHDADEAPDWQWQWVVRPHWRNQWYPSEGRHKPVLIPAHVKGPADKPLKVSQPIMLVAR